MRPPAIGMLVVVVVVAAGCAGRQAATASGEGWQAELSWAPRTLAALKPVMLTLRVFDRGGRPVDVANMSAQAGMPEMEHGATPVMFRRIALGVYETSHTFSMDGRWEVEISGFAESAPPQARISLNVGP